MRAWAGIAAVVLVLATAAPVAAHQAPEATLRELAAASDAVCIGRVTRVVDLPMAATLFQDYYSPVESPLRLAEVSVETWLSPGKAPATLWYVASDPWQFGPGGAVIGERTLFFLQPADELSREPHAPWSALLTATGGAQVRQLSWRGYGRMPIREIAGAPYADVWVGTVHLGPEIEVTAPDALRRAGYRGWARLDALVAQVRARPDAGPSSAAPSSGRDATPLVRLLRRLEDWHGIADDWMEAGRALNERREEFLPELRALLRESSSPWREAAARALGVDDLAAWLDSADAAERRAAAFGLQTLALRDDLALRRLRERLVALAGSDPDPEVRWRLLRALIPPVGGADPTLELPEAGRVLARALADPEEFVRTLAAEAVTSYYDWDWGREAPAERARLLEVLPPLATRGGLRQRRAACAALAHLGGSAVEDLLGAPPAGPDALDPVVRVHLVAGLGRLRTTASGERLETLLRHADPWVRRAAVHALALRQSTTAARVMARAFLDADDSVAEAALQELHFLDDDTLEAAALEELGLAIASTPDPARRARLEEARERATR